MKLTKKKKETSGSSDSSSGSTSGGGGGGVSSKSSPVKTFMDKVSREDNKEAAGAIDTDDSSTSSASTAAQPADDSNNNKSANEKQQISQKYDKWDQSISKHDESSQRLLRIPARKKTSIFSKIRSGIRKPKQSGMPSSSYIPSYNRDCYESLGNTFSHDACEDTTSKAAVAVAAPAKEGDDGDAPSEGVSMSLSPQLQEALQKNIGDETKLPVKSNDEDLAPPSNPASVPASPARRDSEEGIISESLLKLLRAYQDDDATGKSIAEKISIDGIPKDGDGHENKNSFSACSAEGSERSEGKRNKDDSDGIEVLAETQTSKKIVSSPSADISNSVPLLRTLTSGTVASSPADRYHITVENNDAVPTSKVESSSQDKNGAGLEDENEPKKQVLDSDAVGATAYDEDDGHSTAFTSISSITWAESIFRNEKYGRTLHPSNCQGYGPHSGNYSYNDITEMLSDAYNSAVSLMCRCEHPGTTMADAAVHDGDPLHSSPPKSPGQQQQQQQQQHHKYRHHQQMKHHWVNGELAASGRINESRTAHIPMTIDFPNSSSSKREQS